MIDDLARRGENMFLTPSQYDRHSTWDHPSFLAFHRQWDMPPARQYTKDAGIGCPKLRLIFQWYPISLLAFIQLRNPDRLIYVPALRKTHIPARRYK